MRAGNLLLGINSLKSFSAAVRAVLLRVAYACGYLVKWSTISSRHSHPPLLFSRWKKIKGDQLKGCQRAYTCHRCPGNCVRFLLLNTLATILHKVRNVLIHVGPVEAGPYQVYHSIHSQVAHFYAKFIQHKWYELLRQDKLQVRTSLSSQDAVLIEFPLVPFS